MKTILVVDDEIMIASLIKTVIESELKYSVLIAKNGEEALSLFNASDIHFVLTDMKMPGRDGIWLYRKIREKDKDVPIAFMSGFTSITTEDISKFTIVDFVQKPSQIRNIPDLLRTVLEKKK